MRVGMLALGLGLLTAEPALACTLMFEPGPPGETYAQFEARQVAFQRRLEREQQEQDWREADVVFLARVVSLRLVSESEVRVSLRPIVEIQGDVNLPGVVLDRYDPMFDSTCGPTAYALVGDLVVVYADRPTWQTSPLQWGQPRISAVVPSYRNRDPQVGTALRDAAARLRRNEQ